MCAIDALGVAFTFEQDVMIESQCSEESIHVQIKDGTIVELFPDTAHALHVDLVTFANRSGNC